MLGEGRRKKEEGRREKPFTVRVSTTVGSAAATVLVVGNWIMATHRTISQRRNIPRSGSS
ncbi:MAG: hypothetical protein MUE44_18735 [Oscillatoriaceae cyanobacterium Prado104]|nr:hypothetical protein [Oscillatoriaceae cyanobacterium Prado104]